MLASILYDYGRFSVEVKSTLLLGAYEQPDSGMNEQAAEKEAEIADLQTQLNTAKASSEKSSSSTSTAVSSSETVQESAPSTSYTVYITKTGEKYHRDGCRYLKKSQIAIDKDDAVAQGYTPCSVCNP